MIGKLTMEPKAIISEEVATGHLIQVTLRKHRIVCVPGSRGAVEIFRPRLIERRIKAYAFGKIRIGDIVSTKGDEVTGSFGDKSGAMLGVDPGVQDERSRVKATEVMDDGVSAHMFNWTCR